MNTVISIVDSPATARRDRERAASHALEALYERGKLLDTVGLTGTDPLDLAALAYYRAVETERAFKSTPARAINGIYRGERLPRGTYVLSRDGVHIRWGIGISLVVATLLDDAIGTRTVALDSAFIAAHHARFDLDAWSFTAGEIRAWAARQ